MGHRNYGQLVIGFRSTQSCVELSRVNNISAHILTIVLHIYIGLYYITDVYVYHWFNWFLLEKYSICSHHARLPLAVLLYYNFGKYNFGLVVAEAKKKY